MPRHLFVMDPIETIHTDKDTTFAFLLENQECGVDNFVCTVADLVADGANGRARANPVRVRRPTPDNASYVDKGAGVDVGFDSLDVIWMRKDPPVDDTYLYAYMILDLAPRTCRVIND